MVVEKLVEPIFGETLKIKLVIPAFRITFVHFPLILISFVIGYLSIKLFITITSKIEFYSFVIVVGLMFLISSGIYLLIA